MHLILTGATGLVGSGVVSHILTLEATAMPAITKLSILTRRPIPLLQPSHASYSNRKNKHTEINVILHDDFNNYPETLLSQIRGADACIWALGISQNEVSKEDYVKITKDYTLAAAKAFSTLNEKNFNFVWVSGEGATHSPGRFTPIFASVKGETEQELYKLNQSPEYPKLSIYNVRPGGVDGSGQTDVWEEMSKSKNLTWKAQTRILLPPFKLLMPSMITPTKELAQVMIEIAATNGSRIGGGVSDGIEDDGRLVRNSAIRRMAGI